MPEEELPLSPIMAELDMLRGLQTRQDFTNELLARILLNLSTATGIPDSYVIAMQSTGLFQTPTPPHNGPWIKCAECGHLEYRGQPQRVMLDHNDLCFNCSEKYRDQPLAAFSPPSPGTPQDAALEAQCTPDSDPTRPDSTQQNTAPAPRGKPRKRR